MFLELIWSKLYVKLIHNIDNKNEARKRFIIYYIILILLCGLSILLWGGGTFKPINNDFVENFILSLTYILGNFPLLLLLLIKYFKMYYLIYVIIYIILIKFIK